MIILYSSGGAGDFSIQQEGTPEQCRNLLENAIRLLSVRSQQRATEILRAVPFRIVDATNHFNDEFAVLYADLPLREYERLRQSQTDIMERQAFNEIVEVLSELGASIRFIAAELLHSVPQDDLGLKPFEIKKLVSKYIGVYQGYLGDFSYSSHQDFYTELDLDIDINRYEGTTREKFIRILSEATPDVQARILKGVLIRFPIGSSELRTAERVEEINSWVTRLATGRNVVAPPELRITSDVVERALRDAQELLRTTGASSGVDRIHTALHGYLREVCSDAGLSIAEEASLTEVFKQIRESHPAFSNLGPRSDEILRIIRALATILDAFNTLRNRASVAHPNSELLPEPEAMLVINSARSILHYIDQKIFHR